MDACRSIEVSKSGVAMVVPESEEWLKGVTYYQK
jgi:hypothetical protein